MQNSGKIFENQFKKSVPDYCLLQRLNDSPQSFNQSNLTRFAPKNPCDFFLFDDRLQVLHCWELKTTKYKSISFEKIDIEEKQNKMIHKHQILALIDFSKFENVDAGFLFNFRDEKNNLERTYYQNIKDFMVMYKKINKQSFNELDLLTNNAIKLDGAKKRIHYTWNVDKLLQDIKNLK